MDLEQILTRLAEGARQMLQADGAEVRLLDEAGDHLTVRAVSGLPAGSWPQEPIEVASSPLDRRALSGSPVLVDTRSDPQAAGVPGDFRSALCAPLIHQGQPLGTLRVYAAAPQGLAEEQCGQVAPLAVLGAAAVANARAVETLQALEENKARFIRIATHELRSPVTVTQSLVRGVMAGYAGELTEKQADVFGRVSRRLDFMEHLVDDLLDLAAGRAPDLAEEAGPAVVNASVGRAVLLLQPRAEEKGVELVHQGCCELVAVWATEDGLDRVFVNLIGNAIKYTPSGGTVTVSVRRADGRVQIEVADTGIGIPDEALPHLFDEFYRASNARATEAVGTGLGLTIVRDLVEAYGGRIEVESAVGEGSVFTVTFPIYGEGSE